MLTKLSHKTGFTLDEIKVILFLILVFVTAAGFNYFISSKSKSKYVSYNYAKEDSLFFAASNSEDPQEDSSIAEKNEVLGLEKNNNFETYKKKEIPKTAINLNTATLEQLTTLPGIGEKTAQLILDYRIKLRKFKNIDQLDNVKGIGTKKLEKIRPFLTLN